MKTIILQIALVATLFVSCSSDNGMVFTAGDLMIGMNGKGAIVELEDQKSKTNYLFKDTVPNTILAIKVNGKLEYPQTIKANEDGKTLVLEYPKNMVEAQLQVVEKENYLTFELIAITKEAEIELVLWGPFKTTIHQTVGETIGVVRNSEFSIGIQALNLRTLGGYPLEDGDDGTPSYNIFGTTSLVDVSDSLQILYRGHTALPKDYGSSIQAYTRNRSKERIVKTMNHQSYVAPIYKDLGIIGSKIALFGCAPEEVLNTIEKIELAEGLPHPTLNGEWAKRSKLASSAYLIQNFGMESIDEAIALTKKAGLKYLYQSGPFKNWGQFDLYDDAFPDNWESFKACVLKAEKEGIKLGVHTLSNFITTNDAYVTPVPDKRLAKVGASSLVNDIDALAKNIEINDPVFFNQMKNNSLHTAMLGDELVRYESVSETAPWILKNCERGAFGTQPAVHKKNTMISKLADHGYKTFLTSAELGKEMSATLADFYNKTGTKQISFDGLEGNYSTGMGAYGELLFVDSWYQNLAPEIKNDYIMDASKPGHYFWHMFTRMNWGEPWYAGFRESQTAYRLLNQDYFRRNFIPSMLGWFSMRATTSLEDIEWMLARSAGFDAGYALVTSPKLIAENGFGDEILEKIKQWERARTSNSFSVEQKKKMEDINNEYTLQTVSDDSWNLIPYDVSRFEHQLKIRQPGEPVWTEFELENKNVEQPLQFILTTKNSTISNISMEIDNYKKIVFNISLAPKQYLKYTGGNEVILYDETWHKIKSITVDPQKLNMASGSHKLKIDCKFSAKEDASLKLEVKTVGNSENILMKK
ncbi:hypothetical protein MWU65_03905 [Cellulophaga sp. F20128]|uniref:hypothetical protein n=1 Tax=Cellulophaga sp. F20128 TaxID=2926413 RepID=UPI001FF5A11D|nr:hypothetical protein [Cellulophaga sp. F20128]MCK0156309.1 hypothetical protein [Cellulophaga sp. F20128]